MSGFRGSNIPKKSHENQAAHWYLSELTHRLVAKTGIPDDRYHLGKIILQSLKDDTQFLLQINGATGETEDFGSILKRTVQCANGFRKLGVKTGDVMILMAPNHLDLSIPFYAALYLGLTIAPIDVNLKVNELEDPFSVDNPKVIFCQNDKLSDVIKVCKNINLKPELITFDKGDQVLYFADFLENYGNDVSVGDFRASDFDPSTTIATLSCTSGTTGKPKIIAISHTNFTISMPFLWAKFTSFPTPTRLALIVSPVQWLSAIVHFMFTPIMRYTRLQSSLPMSQEHAYYLINKYKPSYMILSPALMTSFIKPGEREKCDFTCFETILIGGSAVHRNIIEEVKKVTPKTEVSNSYAMAETTTKLFINTNSRPGSCGRPFGLYQYRLVDPMTGNDIHEPNVPGELRVQSPALFTGYFKNPKATEATFEDGWFKTGDILYRDQNWNFFFVDRFTQLLKYKNHLISPVKVEDVIRQHPNVFDVAVVGTPDPECGELPVACVVTIPGETIKAQEFENLIKNSLTECMQLKTGLMLMTELPMTPTMKLNRPKLQQISLEEFRKNETLINIACPPYQ